MMEYPFRGSLRLDSSCRACLRSDDSVRSIFESDDVDWADALLDCASVAVRPDDGLPRGLCPECRDDLRGARRLRRRCRGSEARLLALRPVVSVPRLVAPLPGRFMVKMEAGAVADFVQTNVAETRTKTTKRTRECEVCSARFKQKSALDAHRTLHGLDGPVRCDVCRKYFPDRSSMEEHRAADDHRPLRCDRCEFVSYRKDNLAAHMLAHSSIKTHRCDVCPAEFKYFKNLKAHKARHTRKSCDKCQKSFPNERLLREHKSTDVHAILECDRCAYRSHTPARLKAHARTHSKIAPFKCDVCKKKYKHKRSLLQHQTQHGKKGIFRCKDCLKYFRTESLLEEHNAIPNVHTLHKCDKCPYVSYQKFTLIAHMKNHKTPVENMKES